MKKIIKFRLLCAIILALALLYPYKAKIQESLLPIVKEVSSLFSNVESKVQTAVLPCSSPISYSIGTFDEKFGISKEYFLSALNEAKAIWEKSAGKTLFELSPDSGILKINLVYDYRQQATDEINKLGGSVSDTKSTYESLKSKYIALEEEFTTEKNKFDIELKTFNSSSSELKAQVDYWNTKGGASADIYSQLESQRQLLSSESTNLQSEQENLNNQVNEINSLSVVINKHAATLNLTAVKTNTIANSRGESFEEGVYLSDATTQSINIYEFSTRTKLVRLLAHELGHALGLDHVADPKAIMYKLNQGNSLSLTRDDIDALDAKCGIK